MQYCYTIKHKPGREIPHADFLSRAPSTNLFPVEDDDNVVKFLAHAPVSPEELRDNTKKDPVLARVLLLTQHGWPEHCDDPVLTPYFRRRRELSLEGGCVMWGTRVLVPRAMRGAVLQLLHAEHPGMSKMKQLARGYVWWPGLDDDIENCVTRCGICQATRPAQPSVPLQPWSWSGKPWRRVFVDFASKYGKTFFVLVDQHSRYPWVFLMNSTTAAQVISVLGFLYAEYGLLEELVSDNGPPFTSQELRNFLQYHGTRHLFSPVASPRSNGLAEVNVKSFKNTLIRQMPDPTTESRSLQEQVNAFLFAYRNTPHTATGWTPVNYFMRCGRANACRYYIP